MYDVIICGAGVAGSSLAAHLEGLNVLVIERDPKVQLKDSGIVSAQFKDIFDGSSGFIKNKISRMDLLSPSYETQVKTKKPFAYILHRVKFGKELRKRAMKNADFSYEFVRDVKFKDKSAIVSTNDHTYSAKLVIGCEGSLSTVRKSMHIRNPLLCPGIMVIYRQNHDLNVGNTIKVFFNKVYSPDFFTWIIPQNNEYGLMSTIKPREYFERFKKDMNLPDGKLYSTVIPVGFTKSYGDNALLVGESCGQSKPITGGGIMFSTQCAKHAAETIKDAFTEERFDSFFLERYERSWKAEFSGEIRKQLLFRKLYRNITNREFDTIFRDYSDYLKNLDDFDYDRFSDLVKLIPKRKLAKLTLSSIFSLVSRNK